MTARARKSGETFKQYRESLKAEERATAQRLRGRMLWQSWKTRGTPQKSRTYVRKQHGELR